MDAGDIGSSERSHNATNTEKGKRNFRAGSSMELHEMSCRASNEILIQEIMSRSEEGQLGDGDDRSIGDNEPRRVT